ncbi:acetylglutamate kinase [Victivallis vadensis]|jgi:acetylglutamate kinase|uniref:Acetylglutamate kinase n=1 Tax=Victivallis vadensis TaxID=172901 RepID=A0A2U1ANU9_9BACT|nr:acetylglutamate kinase [Victivallis vadensis]NMD88334.1 acetylglutamate kinase [Victivallis vadensis]PVY38109.1 N-acetylglutamate kinase [Victivallis vadensis]HJH05840.1 acetylglutamate kinase [Victivallis vadensis]
MQDLIKKANVLVEALPYIQKFRNSVMVIKFGGSSMEDPELVRSTMRDVVLLEATGIKPVVVHGGGKAISAELRKQDIPVRFVNGLRFTCDRTIRVVDDVLHNQVNRELVELANAAGGNAVGVSGKQVLKAQRTQSVDPVTGEAQDIGFVGEIVGVNGAKILEEVEAGRIPIVTPLGLGLDGQVYNINADVAACKVAEAIHARKLVFLSDVPGILSDRENEASVIPTICTDEIGGLIRDGIISGGMLPKIKSCVEALNSGINKVQLIDGRVMHTLLLEIFTDRGVGTQIVRPDSVM